MAAFLMLAADGPVKESRRQLFAALKVKVAALLGAPSQDESAGPSHLAAKTWLPHSSSRGFGRDGETGSWLACVGTPAGRDVAAVRPEDLAGRLLTMYLAEGRAALEELSAPFLVVIFDGRDGALHVMTDRAGLQRLYAADFDGAHVFSTSALALAAAAGARLDPAGVAAYFRVGHLLGERTLFENITKVGPATWLTVARGRLSQEKYWTPPEGDRSKRALDDYAAEIQNASTEAVRAALASGEPTTVELTGGLDSRLNFAAALASGLPFTAWTIDDVHATDTRIAGVLAGLAGVEHAVVSPLPELRETFDEDLRLIHRLSDGESDCLNVIASPSANRRAARLRTQSVTGIGGELFRGRFYRSKKWLSAEVSLAKLIEWQLCLTTRYDGRLFRAGYADVSGGMLKSVIGPWLDETQGGDVYHRLEKLYLKMNIQGAGGRSMSFNNYFYRQAAPYCSNAMLEIAFRMPARFKATGLAVRRAIERLDPGIADVPLVTGLPARPLRVLDLPRVIGSKAAYAKKVLSKIAAKAGLVTLSEKKDEDLSAVVDERLAALCHGELRLEKMRSAPLYDGDRFRAFVRRNLENGLPDRTQMGLILSMEMTCRYLGDSLRI